MLHKTKVAIIGTVGIPANYGGFETLAEYLTQNLSEDFDITVFCSSKNYPEKRKQHNGARLVYLPINANGVQSIVYDFLSILYSIFFADILLIFGVSGCVLLPFVKVLSSKKVIVNIDGMEWKRAKWSKIAKSFLKYSEQFAVKYADQVVTDNAVIKKYVKDEYAKESTVISYGGDQTQKLPLTEEVRQEYGLPRGEYAFTVCRIEPENNIHMILEAFVQVDLPLVLVGNWENSAYGRELKQRYRAETDLFLLDPVYDQRKLDQLRSNSCVYIHGHSAGGTNPSLVEAMCLALPIIAYDVDYNRETTNGKAYYFASVEDLVVALEQSDEFSLVGEQMEHVGLERYSWQKISAQYKGLVSFES